MRLGLTLQSAKRGDCLVTNIYKLLYTLGSKGEAEKQLSLVSRQLRRVNTIRL